MCFYPRIMKNPRYKKNQKNGGIIPPIHDERVLYVPIGCGECMECKKQKAKHWQVRMMEDLKEHRNGRFVTLTFSNESITKIYNTIEGLTGYNLDNAIATKAVGLWRERWRKKHGKSPRHWLITELGHEGTENIHIHGIVWWDKTWTKTKRKKTITYDIWEEIEATWAYGYIWPRKDQRKKNYVNEKTVNYIIKYITKTDEKHTQYKGVILTSDGIGNAYTKGTDAKKNKYREGETKETYITRSGHEMGLPIYWRNKIYNDDEREKLWIEKLNKQERWVMGRRIDISKDMKEYYKALKKAREKNKQFGFGKGEKNWEQKEYEEKQREIMMAKRIRKEEKEKCQ